MASSTLTSKGQITIPAEIRAELNLQPGDRIDFVKVGDCDIRLFAKNRSVKRLKGMFGEFPRSASIEEINEAIAERGSRLR